MRKYLILAAIALSFAELILLQFDYWIALDECYAVYTSARDSKEADLGYGKGPVKVPVVDRIEYYCQISQCSVAGVTESQGHFIANPDGEVELFQNRDDWMRACVTRIKGPPCELIRVSRFQDPTLLVGQIVLIGLGLSVVVLLCRRR